MGRVLNDLRIFADGRLAVLYLDHDFFRDNPDGWKELEGFSNMGIAIQGVEVSAFLKELSPDHFKISLRSSGSCDVEKIAREYGGGGHSKAAGCEMDGHRDEVIGTITRRLSRELDSCS